MGAEHVNVEEIFNTARQISDPAERTAYLDRACGSDAALRARVDKLLAALDEVGSFLDVRTPESASPPADETAPPNATMASMPLSEKPGTVIGRYKLLQLIGEGGFGSVYMAEQQEPVHRKVALKIIKLGMDTKQVIARFEAERQALAVMEHPNIAKVLDAGATDTGRPYFVMEYVSGVPITEYCDQHLLCTIERLDLFMQVCHAVQHAHQKGIIHRDIKPSNVLVAEEDGNPAPRIIDFGVAKATERHLIDQTLLTEQGQMIGTPAYMSPEQAGADNLDIDTRTDIYSLGVLLYELLVGVLPFDPESLRQAALAEMLRIIREEEPPTPSARLSSLGEDSKTAAHERHADPTSLQRQVKGDLDWITMKAMEKDPARRYATPSDLAADIHRHLGHEPVVAGALGATYRLRKFVRRNRGLVASALVVFVVLVAGVVVSTLFAGRALRAKGEARRQAYFSNIAAVRTAVVIGDFKAVRRQLDAAPPEFRNWEWDYFDAETDHSAAILQWSGTLPAGAAVVRSLVTFSPDGLRLAAVMLDRTVRIWDASTGEELAVLRDEEATESRCVPENGPRSVAFSSDGARVVVAWDDQKNQIVRIRDAFTGEELAVLTGHEGGVNCMALSPDGARLATGSDDNTARLWEAYTGEQLAVLRHDASSLERFDWWMRGFGAVDCVAFSPDGTRLASGSWDRTVRLWDADTGEELAVLRGHFFGFINSVAFSPDGARLASGSGDTTVRLWDADTGEELAVLRGHFSGVSSVAFSPDGTRLASTSYDKTVRLWDALTGEELTVLRGHEGGIYSAAFSPDGTLLASGSMDKTVRLWDVPPARRSSSSNQFPYGPRRRQASAMEQLSVLGAHKTQVLSVAFSPDGARLGSASHDKTIRLWDTSTGEELAVLRGHENQVTSVTFSPDGARLASGSFDKTVRLWDALTGKELTVLRGHEGEVYSAAFSPDGTRVASGSKDGSVRFWDASTGEERAVLRGHESHVSSVAFSPDGTRVASASADDTVRLWAASTGEELTILTAHEHQVWTVAFSPDGTLLASGSPLDPSVRLWDARTGEELAVLGVDVGGVRSVAFNPDGTRLASAGQGSAVRIWDPSSAEELVVLQGHESSASSVAFSPDGTGLAFGCNDGTVHLLYAVPHSIRYRERQAILAARPEAQSIVEGLWQELGDWDSVTQEIRGDGSLDEPVRRAVLNEVLRRATARP